jgi:hypothetical protein
MAATMAGDYACDYSDYACDYSDYACDYSDYAPVAQSWRPGSFFALFRQMDYKKVTKM